MNINPDQITQLLNKLPYPISKSQLVDMAKQHGANAEMTGMLDKLPDKTYNSSQDIMSSFSSIGGGGFKL
ncbi:DUF2795 domain-containing protein [Dictyobacter arantiisoli]|uniref:DUF2795 domain-containing protein n=1 Tax=Dictyobacter arantiisoli TaxID=2014874 RepID=A0A5A5THM0_9CHLR|nr:DUF2795 domain-containing protein [Dictyobacter arantiisoli]GCF10735.1 hypothetical protein KDI_42990 [Dictyobacter arantiisoli]